jgi:colanic acid/amylovoran biosynthesis protein WcaK/AmsJ
MNNNINSLINILIINQHGENRGDEAAMRAMIRTLDKQFDNARFKAIVQFKDKNLKIKFEQDVELLHMVMSINEAAGFMLYIFFRLLKIRLNFLLTDNASKIIKAYESSNIVLSAPGGPYFGDIYYKHELVHWLYVWLAEFYGKKLFLYSPSAGPFKSKILNVIRKRMYKNFSVLCVRENYSKQNLQQLLGPKSVINLTADSAIQETIQPLNKRMYFADKDRDNESKFIVAVTGHQYQYPGDPNPSKQRAEFTKCLKRCFNHLCENKNCHFMFFPQLCGNVHSDYEYHEYLGSSLPLGVSWEIIDRHSDSDIHRKLFGMADFCIASRYHPQIFATTNGIPGIYICYEHKQFSYLSDLGISDFAFDIRNINIESILLKIDEALCRYNELSSILKTNITQIQERARKSTELCAEFYKKNIISA